MKFKILMIQAGLTQAEFAEKLGTYQQKVSGWIRGSQPDYAYIPKIAKVLNTTIEDVVMAFINEAV